MTHTDQKLTKMFALPYLPREFRDRKFRQRFRMRYTRLLDGATLARKHLALAGLPRKEYRRLWTRLARAKDTL